MCPGGADPREKWITNRIMSFLNISDETLVTRMLDRREGRARKKLRKFIEGSGEIQIFYAYKTYYLKTFYKEVTIFKEVPRPKGASPTSSVPDEDAPSAESDEDDKTSKKDGNKGKKVKGKKSKSETSVVDGEEASLQTLEGELVDNLETIDKTDSPDKKDKRSKNERLKTKPRPRSPASVVETLPSEYTENKTMTITLKKILKKEKRLIQCHLKFEPLRPSSVKDAYVYFLLRSVKGIPIMCTNEEATAEMPEYVYVGQCSTNILDDFIVKCKILKLYCFHSMVDKFDVQKQLTDGLEKIVKHRRKDKGNQPRLDEYKTAGSFAQLVAHIERLIKRKDRKAKLMVKESFLARDGLKKLKGLKSYKNVIADITSNRVEKDALMRVLTVSSILSRMGKKPQDGQSSLKGNFLSSIDHMENVAKWCSLHNSSTRTFKLPKLRELRKLTQNKVEVLVENQNYFNFLESIIKFWTKYIEASLKKYSEQLPEGKGPLSLYEYWRVRCEELSPIVDECFQPIVKNLIGVLQHANSSLLLEFKKSRMRLNSYYKICSENTEYLEYIVKELKFLTQTKCLRPIISIIPRVMDSLRIIWVLSSYWGTAPCFIELLKRLRWVLCTKVTKVLNVPKLFIIKNEAARTACYEAVEVMETWKSSYVNTRAMIEKTECEERWEFDRDLLFHETDYISQVANSLFQILSVVDVYQKIFSPKFVETVTDPTKIDKIQHKIQDLINPITTSDFNIFDRDFAENWKIILEYFWNELQNLEREAIEVINYSFSSLRSASKSLSLLSEFHDCNSFKIFELLNHKYDDVMIQFSEEVKQLLDAFIEFRQQSVILQSHPLRSGSVYWSRGLVLSLKQSLDQLLTTKEVYETKTKDEALNVYSNFIEMISKYETKTYNKWLQCYLPITRKVFVTNILKLVPIEVNLESYLDSECWSFLNKRTKKRHSEQLRSRGRNRTEQNVLHGKKEISKRDVTESKSISKNSNFVQSSSFTTDKSVKKSLNEIVKSFPFKAEEIDKKMIMKHKLSEFHEKFTRVSFNSASSTDSFDDDNSVDLVDANGDSPKVEALKRQRKPRKLSRSRARKMLIELGRSRWPIDAVEKIEFDFQTEQESGRVEKAVAVHSNGNGALRKPIEKETTMTDEEESQRSCSSSSEVDLKAKVRERMMREKNQHLQLMEKPEPRYTESSSESDKEYESQKSDEIDSQKKSAKKNVESGQRLGIKSVKRGARPKTVKLLKGIATSKIEPQKRYYAKTSMTPSDIWFYEPSVNELVDISSKHMDLNTKIADYVKHQESLSLHTNDFNQCKIQEVTDEGNVDKKNAAKNDQVAKESLVKCKANIGKIATGCRHDVTRYPWWQFMGDDILLEHGYTIAVNFSKGNETIIKESQLFSELGFKVPSKMENFVSLRHFLHEEIVHVGEVTKKYADFMAKLKPSQILALKPAMRSVERRISNGFIHHTWSSLSIPEFCETATLSLNQLEFLRRQIVSIEDSISTILTEVSQIDFFQLPNCESIDLQDFFQYVKNQRNSAETKLHQCYDELSKQMLKLELALFQEPSKMNKYLVLYYMCTQLNFFEALIDFVQMNLKRFKSLLEGQSSVKFSVYLTLEDYGLRLEPKANSVAQILAYLAEDLIKRTKHIARWIEGTCIKVPHLVNMRTLNSHRYSYAEDLIRHKPILSQLNDVYYSMSTVMEGIDRYIESWKPVSHTWNLNVELTVEKFINDKPTLAEYDECFLFYETIIKELDDSSNYKDVFCVRIIIDKLIVSIKKCATDWKKVLGEKLIQSAKDLIESISVKMNSLKVSIAKETNDLESYQRVLQAVKDCCDLEIEVRLIFTGIVQRIHLLKMWNVPNGDSLDRMLDQSRNEWFNVKRNAAYRSATLKPSMKYFTTSALKTSHRFLKEVEEFGKNFRRHGPATYTRDLNKGLEAVKSYKGQFDTMLEKIASAVQAEVLFNLPPGNFDLFQDVYCLYTMIEMAFGFYEKQQAKKLSWCQLNWSNFNGEKLKLWTSKIISEFNLLPEECQKLGIASEIRRNFNEFLQTVDLMVKLQNKVLRERHWEYLMTHANHRIKYDKNDDFKLQEMFEMNLHQHSKLVEEILLNANREREIEKELSILVEHWTSMDIPLSKYPKHNLEENYNYLLGSFDVIRELDESCLRLQAMESSRFSTPFESKIKLLLKQLTQMVEVLKLFEIFYKEWSSLTLIFRFETVEELVVDKKKFIEVEGCWFEINRCFKNKPNLMEQFLQKCLREQIEELLITLENTRKSVCNFLGKKCAIFPRFYLLSDDEMLHLFGNNPLSSVQRCVKKIFESVSTLNIEQVQILVDMAPHLGQTSTQTFITGVESLKGELLKFVSSVNTHDRLEVWILNVENSIKKAVKFNIKRAIENRPSSGLGLATKYLGMAMINAVRVWWTNEVESAFHGFIQDEAESMGALLHQYSHLLSDTSQLIRTTLSSEDRQKYSVLLIQYISMKDVVQKLVTLNVLDRWDFEWQCQIRSYWMTSLDSLVLEQCNERFEYGYEFDGSVERIVSTPLTTRAQFAITHAISSKSGVMLSGPSSTGKKETIKDLAKVLGVRCMIVNCVKFIRYAYIEKLFHSLFECKMWACFDRFDELDSCVLSVISPLITRVLKLEKQKIRPFVQGTNKINLTSVSPNMFIILSPGSSNRQDLPESLIIEFRPFALMVPASELICELLLQCEGFRHPKTLSRKMCALNKLMRNQFSMKEPPLSLRVLRKIISSSGCLLRETTENSELLIIKKALLDCFKSQIPLVDISIFNDLLNDVFPGVYLKADWNSSDKEIICSLMKEKLYSITDGQIEKIMQLRVSMLTLRSAIVVGSTCTGKSAVIRTCTEMDVKYGHFVSNYVFSPKAYSYSDLFGFNNEVTKEWTDGTISSICKKINSKTLTTSGESLEKINIIFDGQIDSSWIENLSALMDESRTLMLANCNRIALDHDYFIIFETGNLGLASPVIISRALLVYMDSNTINYSMLWTRWLKKRVNEREIECLSIMFDAFVPSLMVNSFSSSLHRNEINLIQQLCHVLEAMLPIIEEEYSTEDTNQSAQTSYSNEINCIFIDALYWSLGSNLDSASREKFDRLTKDLWLKMNFKNGELPDIRPTLYHYTYCRKKACWMDWSARVVEYIHKSSSNFTEMIVPTEDNARNEWILDIMTKHNCEDVTYATYEYRVKVHPKTKRPILFVGETGSLKTSLIGKYLNGLDSDSHILRRVNCTKNTTSREVQNIIESNVDNLGRNTYGPSQGKKLIVFLDDLHAPNGDCYGSVQPLEFIRLLAGKQGFYERGGKNGWKKIVNTYIYAALTFCLGNQLEIDPRLSSQFSIFTMNLPSVGTAQKIFSSILNGHFYDFSAEIRDSIQGIATLTIEFVETISKKLLPSPNKFVYEFNVRTLSQIFKSLLHASKALYSNKPQVLRLLRNEILRTVSDRVLDSQDKTFIENTLNDSMRKHFPDSNGSIWSEPLLFGDFRNAMIEDGLRLYEDLLDYNAVFHLFTEISVKFEENGGIGLILFEDALEHLIRIHRILRQGDGHAMIFGPAGTGKRSLIELASFGAGCSTYRLQLNNTDTISSFTSQISSMLEKSLALENGLTLLLASEFDINEDILEAIFNLICRGLIPSSCITESAVGSNEDRFNEITSDFYYREDVVTLCRTKLHIVLSLSLEEQRYLSSYSTFFPGLMSRVYINWVLPWTSEAYHAIANEHLKDVEFIEDEIKGELMDEISCIHEDMLKYSEDYFKRTQKRNYVNPNHFSALIKGFFTSIQVKKSDIISKVQRYKEGIEKIELLENQLLTLGAMLDNQKQEVKLKLDEISQITRDLSTVTEEFEEKQESLKETGQEIATQRKKLFQLQTNLEKMLKVAAPISASAKGIVESLDQDSVSEICLLPIVPEPVQVVCECVAVLKGSEGINWPNAKTLFEDPFLLHKLKDMDYNTITISAQQLVRSHMKTSKRMGEMKEISSAGLGLLHFVESVLDYCSLYRDIKPKQEKLRCLEEELMKLTTSLEDTTTEIEDGKVLIRSMKNRQNLFIEEQNSLQGVVDEMQQKYDLVSDLINRLKQKKNTWEKEKRALELQESHILGNQLIETAFINYTSFFDPVYRTEIVYKGWFDRIKSTSIPILHEFRIENFIGEETKNLWVTQGFEPEGTAIQNCIFVELSSKVPIFVDPQKQARRWIVDKESGDDFVQVQAYDDNIFDVVYEAMTKGQRLLVENYEEYNETIQSLLQYQGKGTYTLRGQTVNAHENFRIYIIASFGAKLCPETFVKGCVINFDMTPQALEDHLIGCASLTKDPSNESYRRSLLLDKHNNILELLDYDSKVLTGLGIIIEGQTDVFHEYESVSSLNELTLIESQVQQRHNKCILNIKSSNDLRNLYRSIAKKGTVLFKNLSRMSLINYIYQFSLDYFQNIFKTALCKTQDNNEASLSRNLLEETFSSACKGIFEQDKLIFTLDLILSLELLDLKVTKEKLIFLLEEDEQDREPIHVPQTFTWITLEGKKLLKKLADELPSEFSRLPADLVDNESDWKRWIEKDDCSKTTIPEAYSGCSQFDWLLLVKCFRKERLYEAIIEYTRSAVGDNFLILRNKSLQEIMTNWEPTTPTIFFMGPNSETEELLSVLKTSKGRNDVIEIGVGNKTDGIILEKVKSASSKGYQILLTNTHLSRSLLTKIDRFIEKTAHFEEGFQLWVTSKLTHDVPLSFLMRAQKILYETSSTLKLNLMNTYERIPEDLLNSCSHPAFKTVVYSLAFLHAVISERKTLENTDWPVDSVSWQRNFNVSLEYLLSEMTTNSTYREDKISWSAVKCFIGEISYGGCLRTVQDYRVLQTFIDEYFGDFLFDSKQPFSFDQQSRAIEYASPCLNSRADYLDYIGDLPLFTPASVVGLSKHSEVERNFHSMYYFRKTMMTLESVSLKEKETYPDETSQVAEIIDQILSAVPSDALSFNNSTSGKEIKPFDVFLSRDLTSFNMFTNKICAELNLVKEVLFDGKLASSTLHNILNCLKAGELPYEWRTFPPYTFTHVGEWTSHLKKRIALYHQWITRGEPWIIWLSGLCKPEAYLMSLAQSEFRDKGVPLDEIMFRAEITDFNEKKQIPNKPDQGCYVEGLILDRVKWDRDSRSLCDSLQYGLVDPLPIVQVIPLQMTKKMQSKGELLLPVFTSVENKTELSKLFDLSVFVGRDINYWAVRNICVVLNKQSETLNM